MGSPMSLGSSVHHPLLQVGFRSRCFKSCRSADPAPKVMLQQHDSAWPRRGLSPTLLVPLGTHCKKGGSEAKQPSGSWTPGEANGTDGLAERERSLTWDPLGTVRASATLLWTLRTKPQNQFWGYDSRKTVRGINPPLGRRHLTRGPAMPHKGVHSSRSREP